LHNVITSLSLIETIRLIVRILTEATVWLCDKEIAFRLKFGLCSGMKEQKPFIDENGTRYYNVRQAAQIVEGVSEATLWHWAAKGVTSFGFELDTERKPLRHDPRSYREDARTHRTTRMLLPENKVLALKEILHTVGRDQPGPWTPEEMDRLRTTARRYKQTAFPPPHH
jgi:hypothetical protein